jgi:hypothetical protein
VRVAGGSVFEEERGGPGSAIVGAEAESEIAALVCRGRIGEEEAAIVESNERGFADGVGQEVIEGRGGPAGDTVGTGRDEAPADFGLSAGVKEDAAVAEFDEGGFTGVDEVRSVWDGDAAEMPGGSVVVAVKGGDDGGAVGVALCSEREPDGDEETSAAKADAVSGSRGEDLPGIGGPEGFESGGDFDRRREGAAAVRAAAVKTAHVLDAEDEVKVGGAASGDGDRVVVEDGSGVGDALFDGGGVFGDGRGDGGD